MTDDLQKRIQAALANPQNMGEMAGADSIGTVKISHHFNSCNRRATSSAFARLLNALMRK
jgi:hypothetical protein